MNLLNPSLIATALAGSGWWALARHRYPAGLQRLSAVTATLAAVTLLVIGPQYPSVPWIMVGAAAGVAAALRRWRPGRSRRWRRVIGRGAWVAACAVGAITAMPAFVPTLPAPAGPRHVASTIFRWTDAARPETLTAATTDHRQVTAQAWYPTDAVRGKAMPYYEAQDRLPSSIAGLPAFMFAGFSKVDTHAIQEAPISAARGRWPVLVFTPGLSVPREWYAGLCADLASRGYVVLALSAAYESPVTVLADGHAAYQRVYPDVAGPPPHPEVQRLIDLRVGDIRFALDRLNGLQQGGHSPLGGRLNLDRIGIVGHSIGGAAAVQAMAADLRVKTGVDLDGKLFGAQPDARLQRRFLWIESADPKTAEYTGGRDRLMRNLGANGALMQLKGSTHMSFSDSPQFWTTVGRKAFNGLAAIGSPTTAARAASAIDRFERGAEAPRPQPVAESAAPRRRLADRPTARSGPA